MVFGIGKKQVGGYKKAGFGQGVPMYKSIRGLQGMTGRLAGASKTWNFKKRK